MASTMKAAVIHVAGGPEVLKLSEVPKPTASANQVLIRVKAFGLNRSEMFTRQGASPNVKFPRILGIEAVGVVEDAPGSDEFAKGDVVATAMGGMGRDFDGGYAEYTVVSASNVQKIDSQLPWEVLGAMPEMLQTAYGALMKSLKLQKTDTLLLRGGTTSVGLAAAGIAKAYGCPRVIATTRSLKREQLLRDSGVDEVIVDNGEVAAEVQKLIPGGVDKCLELVGVTSLRDSLNCLKAGTGICSITGIVGGQWELEKFSPMDFIPDGVCLTKYSGGPEEFMELPLKEMARQVAAGKMKVQIGKVFKLDDIVEAHRVQEANKAGGKIVVLT